MNDLTIPPVQHVISPKLIFDKISETVIGQTEAKMVIANAFFLHYVQLCYKTDKRVKKPMKKPNTILLGPSGNGKTHIVKAAAKAVQDITGTVLMPLVTIDATGITPRGYVGDDIGDHLYNHYNKYKHAPAILNSVVIYVDEIDKLCTPSITSSGNDFHKDAQYSFLKIMEGEQVQLNEREGIFYAFPDALFIFSGNFPDVRINRDEDKKTPMGFTDGGKSLTPALDLHRQLQKAGMATQLAGRISQAVELNKLTELELEQIVRSQLLPDIVRLYDYMDYNVWISDAMIKKAVNEAIEAKTGARGLQSSLEKSLQEELFNIEFPIFITREGPSHG